MTTFGDMVYGLGGIPLLGGEVIGAKTVYFVDGNYGNDSNSGKNGWADAFKTLTVALAASNADIASGAEGWAARNVIYCKGDTFTEDLVLLAQKTDVVGVGSYNANPQPGLVGNHVPTGTTAGYGTRFINFHFAAPAAGGAIWTLDSTCTRLTFIGCTFDGESTTKATHGINAVAPNLLSVRNCTFDGRFSTAAIAIGAGDAPGLRIVGNDIQSAAVGILVNSSATCVGRIGKIMDNHIYATTLGIDENADKFVVTGNTIVSAATTLAAAVDTSKALSVANYVASTDLNQLYPTEDTTE